jgi:hypothetical protein
VGRLGRSQSGRLTAQLASPTCCPLPPSCLRNLGGGSTTPEISVRRRLANLNIEPTASTASTCTGVRLNMPDTVPLCLTQSGRTPDREHRAVRGGSADGGSRPHPSNVPRMTRLRSLSVARRSGPVIPQSNWQPYHDSALNVSAGRAEPGRLAGRWSLTRCDR